MEEIEEAKKLLNELHRERLDYDEYSILYDCIMRLQDYTERLRKINIITQGVINDQK